MNELPPSSHQNPEDKDNNNDNQINMRKVAVFMTMPFVLALPPILGWYIGAWLDGKFGTAPYGMYLLLLLGFVAGVREFIRTIMRYG